MKKLRPLILLFVAMATTMATAQIPANFDVIVKKASFEASAATDVQLGINNDPVITNHQSLPGLLTEFYDAARFYRIDYGPELAKLQKVIVVDADLNFIGDVVNHGREIHINSALLQYPNLFRVIFNRQMGKLYGLKAAKQNHAIMGECWKIDAKHEKYAEKIRKYPYQKETFFLRLFEERPLEKRL